MSAYRCLECREVHGNHRATCSWAQGLSPADLALLDLRLAAALRLTKTLAGKSSSLEDKVVRLEAALAQMRLAFRVEVPLAGTGLSLFWDRYHKNWRLLVGVDRSTWNPLGNLSAELKAQVVRALPTLLEKLCDQVTATDGAVDEALGKADDLLLELGD